MSEATIEGEYDYIIVGAGSAGCLLANRLSTDADKRVLRGPRNKRRADKGVTADEAGVVGADQFDPRSINDPDQVLELVYVLPVGKRRPA